VGMCIRGVTVLVSEPGFEFLRWLWSMRSRVMRVSRWVSEVISVVEYLWIVWDQLLKLSWYWSIIALLESCKHRKVCFKFTCFEVSTCPIYVHLSWYPLYVYLSYFTFIDEYLFSGYDVGCFRTYPYFVTTC